LEGAMLFIGGPEASFWGGVYHPFHGYSRHGPIRKTRNLQLLAFQR
jgi:hypothetical protein